MSNIIIPSNTEPQINEQALDQVSSDVLQKGLFRTGLSAAALLIDNERKFAAHIINIADELTVEPINLWPRKTLYIGAGLAWKAYRETGYYQRIDDGFTAAKQLEINKGGSHAYLSSLVCDPTLSLLLEISRESKELNSYVGTDMERVLAIGAGCVRFYLQQAVVAA